MPLIHSHTDEDREKNIKEMIGAGHEPEQAVAAAYAIQRKAKKMADGGEVGSDGPADGSAGRYDPKHVPSLDASKIKGFIKGGHFFDGGPVEEEEHEDVPRSNEEITMEGEPFDEHMMLGKALAAAGENEDDEPEYKYSDGGEVETEEEPELGEDDGFSEAQKDALKRYKASRRLK